MLFRKTVAVCCEYRAKHKCTLGQNAELSNVEVYFTYGNLCALKDKGKTIWIREY
jgi:hypothetical protein